MYISASLENSSLQTRQNSSLYFSQQKIWLQMPSSEKVASVLSMKMALFMHFDNNA